MLVGTFYLSVIGSSAMRLHWSATASAAAADDTIQLILTFIL
jgi:hypothetical protein